MSRSRNVNMQLLEAIGGIKRLLSLQPLVLGGSSGGAGGSGGPPGGFTGYLPQSRVAYDSTEASSGSSPNLASASVVDNLNRLRHWTADVRWFEPGEASPGGLLIAVRSGVWWYDPAQPPLIYGGSNGPLHPLPSSGSRIDVLYLTSSGSLLTLQGAESASPVATYPKGPILPIAEILLRPSSGSILLYDNGLDGFIHRDIRPFIGQGNYHTSGSQVLAYNTTISPNARTVQVSSGSPITLVSAPTISDGYDGQRLGLVNTGTEVVTFQDQGTLPSSNLRLSATGVALGQHGSIEFVFLASAGDWLQTTVTSVV